MAEPRPVQLRDVLPYEPETYLTESDLKWIQDVFRGDERGIKILRKLFLPTALDPELPIEEISGDAWMANIDFTQMQVGEVKAIVLGRQDAIKFVIGGLLKLKVIANQKEETPQNREIRRAKDSGR